ncbi:MAG TPA: hypothetical protein VFK70_00145, partial [Vicinamibacteria bacterium]|nr:hypothetical protein [Vicinamibacteria bacterium]
MAAEAGRVAHGHEADLVVGFDREIPLQDEVEVAERAGAGVGVAGEEGGAGENGEGRGQDGKQGAARRGGFAQARRRSSRWMSPVTSAALSPTYMS